MTRDDVLEIDASERARLGWSDIDSDVQEALLKWFNYTSATKTDQKRLARLWWDGRFWYWDCLLCNDSCVHAEPTPEEWKHFQGAHDDIDWCYFGNQDVYTRAALASMCNSCRCHKCGVIPDGSPGWQEIEEVRE